MKIDEVKLKILMLQKGLTTKQLSYNARVSAATITAVRNGKSCSYNTAAHLAMALGCKVEDLQPDAEKECIR